jgi:penicillin-binding protein 2
MQLKNRKISIYYLLTLIIFSSFVIRLAQLQLVKGEEFLESTLKLSQRTLIIPAKRARILDRHSNVLVDNSPSFTIFINQTKISDQQHLIKVLSQILSKKKAIVKQLFEKRHAGPAYKKIVLVENLSYDQAVKISSKLSLIISETERPQHKRNLESIQLETVLLRKYPNDPAFGHLLGYTKIASLKDIQEISEQGFKRLSEHEQVGKRGVEALFDRRLRGKNGFREILVNSKNQRVESSDLKSHRRLNYVSDQRAEDLVLSIDKDLQSQAYAIFRKLKLKGSLVAINPNNGQVMALASYPSYNSNALSSSLSLKAWNFYAKHRQKILINRSVQAAYPPGSIYKIITAIAGLAENEIKQNTRSLCRGKYNFGNRDWLCWNHSGHGSVDLAEALIESCDVYFYELGLRLGPDKIAKYAKLLGLGTKTGLFDDFERAGLIPDSDFKRKNNSEFKASDPLQLAIGQGQNLLTPLQAALFTAQVVNGGYRIKPTLVYSDQKNNKLEKLDLGISEKQLNEVKLALAGVVSDKDGTGKAAKLDGISVGGKTGTAQVVARDKVTHAKLRDHAWFVAFAPVENPQIVVAVLVENGGSGGKVAAPIAGEFLKIYFEQYPLDDDQVIPAKAGIQKIANDNFSWIPDQVWDDYRVTLLNIKQVKE